MVRAPEERPPLPPSPPMEEVMSLDVDLMMVMVMLLT